MHIVANFRLAGLQEVSDQLPAQMRAQFTIGQVAWGLAGVLETF